MDIEVEEQHRQDGDSTKQVDVHSSRFRAIWMFHLSVDDRYVGVYE